ncbi:MAG: LytTR family DNA-binding domain-containing protein [Ignavibacteria bacterium]|nr:LytTR family DNA-binding domain-containing protein [Ignavibacteria bacterium]
MTPIYCLIVEDEAISRQFLEHYVEQIDYLSIVGSCKSAKEALDILHDQHVDLILLDIELPGKNGLQFLDELDTPPAVILVTAREQYAVKAFEYDVIDYLVKPVTLPRLQKATQKVLKLLNQDTQSPKPEAIFVKSGAKLQKVSFNKILFIEAQGDYVHIICSDKKYIMYNSMSEIIQKLPEESFSRVHRSYIINLQFVDGIMDNVITLGSHSVPLGSSYRKNFLQKIRK